MTKKRKKARRLASVRKSLQRPFEYEAEMLSTTRRRLVVHLLYFRLVSKLRNSLKTLG
jgi:hypothetical protein